MRRILLIEDEPGLVVLLSDRLRATGFEVEVARDGLRGLERARGEPFDLIVLDVLLPHKDGLEVCRELRALGLGTPILMLTALGELVDKVVGLRVGADDYLTKPFAMAELLARIEALLRRAGTAPHGALIPSDPYRFGEVEVHFRQAMVLRNGEPVHMTAQLFELLRLLVVRRGEALSRDELLDGAWGPEAIPSARTVDVHVAWLRQRIEPNPKLPRYLLTVRGLGYRFVG